jgi:integrase
MARQPGLWYRAQRDAWYTKIDGRPYMLAKGKANRADAQRAFHGLMAQRGKALEQIDDPPIGELYAAWLEELDDRVARDDLAPRTREWYEMILCGFAEACGDLRASELRPHHVKAWLADRAKPGEGMKRGMGPTSRHHAVATVKAILRWALKDGRIDKDPLASLEMPARQLRREAVLSPAQWETALGLIRSDGFRDFAVLLYLTGARLGEAAGLTAADVDLAAGVATVREHKTRRRSGAKTLFLPAEAVELCRRLAAKHPTGPLFRGSRGEAWTRSAVNGQMRRLRKRSQGQLGHELYAHALRHLFGTDALVRGTPLPIVASLLGHRSTATTDRFYNHARTRSEEIRLALAAVRPAVAASPTPQDAKPASASADAAAEPLSDTSPGTRRGRPAQPGSRRPA